MPQQSFDVFVFVGVLDLEPSLGLSEARRLFRLCKSLGA